MDGEEDAEHASAGSPHASSFSSAEELPHLDKFVSNICSPLISSVHRLLDSHSDSPRQARSLNSKEEGGVPKEPMYVSCDGSPGGRETIDSFESAIS